MSAKLTNRNFFIRLNSLSDPTDAVANDVQYHQLCWIYAQRDAQPPKDKVLNQKHCVIADIEILNAIKCELTNPTGVPMNMNNINATCNNLLNENQYEYTGNDYKKHLKHLNIEFIKPKCRNESEKICRSATKDAVVDDAFENVEENIDYLFQTAKMIREEEGKRKQWSLDGSFEGYQSSDTDMLRILLRWIIAGQKTELILMLGKLVLIRLLIIFPN